MKIPEGIPSEAAAPMLCGGITLYSPLKNHGCGPGKKVGIIGVGGLVSDIFNDTGGPGWLTVHDRATSV